MDRGSDRDPNGRRHGRTPVAGDLTLRYGRLAVDGDPGLEIDAYLAEPGSRSAEAVTFLASYPGRSDLPSLSSVSKDV